MIRNNQHDPDPFSPRPPPHPFAEELAYQGHQVFEAVAISEVYALADQHLNATIIITADVDTERDQSGPVPLHDPASESESYCAGHRLRTQHFY
jgi:hypothetical protein